MKRGLQVLCWPVLVAGSGGAAALLLGRGASPAFVAAALPIACAICVALLERLLPYRAAWARSRGDVLPDALHLLVGVGLTEAVSRGVAASGPGGWAVWPGAWPLWAQLALAVGVAEAGAWLCHVALHRVPALWRFHALHHSAERLYWVNSGRLHPVDALLSALCSVGPLVLLGAGAEILALFTVLSAAHLLLQHSNVDSRLGPLSWVVASAEVHRWHHSRDREEADANYGHLLLVFDLLFGTRKVPEDRAPPEDVGEAPGAVPPRGYWAQLASPFADRSATSQPTPRPKATFDPNT